MRETYVRGDYELKRFGNSWKARTNPKADWADVYHYPLLVNALLDELHPAPPVTVTLPHYAFERNEGGSWKWLDGVGKFPAPLGEALDRIVELGGADS